MTEDQLNGAEPEGAAAAPEAKPKRKKATGEPAFLAAAGSEQDMAARALPSLIGQYLYVAMEKKWLRRTRKGSGEYWADDKKLRVREDIRKCLAQLSIKTSGSESIARAIASGRAINAVESICRSHPEIAAESDQFDTAKHMLNTSGGIVDLRNGLIRPTLAADMVRRITTVAPFNLETARSLGEAYLSICAPNFLKVLSHTAHGNAAMMRHFQKVAGYCLWESQDEKVVIVVVGPKDSGKSTMFRAIGDLMGSYASTVNVEEILEDSRHLRTSTHAMSEVVGCRMVVVGEPDKNTRLSAAWLKRTVGIDVVTTRANYSDSKRGVASWTWVLHCNDIPKVGGDPAIMRRLHILPGGDSIPEDQQDPRLLQALEKEAGAILAWMILGAVLWHQEGLGSPPDMSAAEDYRRKNDPLTAWLHSEGAVLDPAAFTATERAWAAHSEFCRSDDGIEAGLKSFYLEAEFAAALAVYEENGQKLFRKGVGRVDDGKQKRGFYGLLLRSGG